MAHIVESNASADAEKEVDMEENSDAQFAGISHSRALVSPSEEEFELIVKKLNMLIAEGRGECIFEVGLGTDPPACEESNGQPVGEDAEAASGLNLADFEASVATLQSIADSQDADCVLLRQRVLSGGGGGSDVPPEARRTGQYLIRKRADSRVIKKKIFSTFEK